MSTKTKMLLCKIVFGFGLLNFLVYLLASIRLGGDAISGKSLDGRYFLMSHGAYTEVTRSVFTYSKYHTYAVWITHPAALLAGGLYHSLKKRSLERQSETVSELRQ